MVNTSGSHGASSLDQEVAYVYFDEDIQYLANQGVGFSTGVPSNQSRSLASMG